MLGAIVVIDKDGHRVRVSFILCQLSSDAKVVAEPCVGVDFYISPGGFIISLKVYRQVAVLVVLAYRVRIAGDGTGFFKPEISGEA